jgi:large subunit ribosomal protein L9
MDVILMNDQRNLGRRGQVVDVKPGYARNYLIPQGLAMEATKANLAYFEQQRGKIEARHLKEREAAAEVAAKLLGMKLSVPKRVGETDTLYGSVTASEVAELLAAKGFEIDRRRIDLEGGIKTLGDHPVRVELHPDVVAEIIVSVERAE